MDKQSEVAPHIQDDFDIVPGELAVLDIAERPENQVRPESYCLKQCEVKLLWFPIASWALDLRAGFSY